MPACPRMGGSLNATRQANGARNLLQPFDIQAAVVGHFAIVEFDRVMGFVASETTAMQPKNCQTKLAWQNRSQLYGMQGTRYIIVNEVDARAVNPGHTPYVLRTLYRTHINDRLSHYGPSWHYSGARQEYQLHPPADGQDPRSTV